MSDKTKIEWSDATWNPIRGCSRVSEGCRNCYAENVANRFSGEGQPYEGLIKQTSKGPKWNGNIMFLGDVLLKPLKWKKPRRIFVNSMSDLFHENVKDEWIDKIFAVIALCPQHHFQILTKRPERMKEYILWRKGPFLDRLSTICTRGYALMSTYRNGKWNEADAMAARIKIDQWAPDMENVSLGVSIESAEHLDRIKPLVRIPGGIKFISFEPLLGSVREADLSKIDWVIVGGESGSHARPMHPEWAREIRDKCEAENVAFFFKQWGEWRPWEQDAQPPYFNSCTSKEWMDKHHFPDFDDPDCKGWCYDLTHFIDYPVKAVCFEKIGKKKAGNLLDGRKYQQYPETIERNPDGRPDQTS